VRPAIDDAQVDRQDRKDNEVEEYPKKEHSKSYDGEGLVSGCKRQNAAPAELDRPTSRFIDPTDLQAGVRPYFSCRRRSMVRKMRPLTM
jgi:hypothetical protein